MPDTTQNLAESLLTTIKTSILDFLTASPEISTLQTKIGNIKAIRDILIFLNPKFDDSEFWQQEDIELAAHYLALSFDELENFVNDCLAKPIAKTLIPLAVTIGNEDVITQYNKVIMRYQKFSKGDTGNNAFAKSQSAQANKNVLDVLQEETKDGMTVDLSQLNTRTFRQRVDDYHSLCKHAGQRSISSVVIKKGIEHVVELLKKENEDRRFVLNDDGTIKRLPSGTTPNNTVSVKELLTKLTGITSNINDTLNTNTRPTTQAIANAKKFENVELSLASGATLSSTEVNALKDATSTTTITTASSFLSTGSQTGSNILKANVFNVVPDGNLIFAGNFITL